MKLPLRVSATEIGSIVDADGIEVCVVDVHRDRSDEEVSAIASMIVDAVNAKQEQPR
ncbi:conserved hypothetical protein [Mesorhizobium plurifarium]|uniref:Uncharacterized protein n=1 Tax=Mesorhizobium plurifarium TaxID=69974 RepID=A0A090EFJ6_MESPL|nr:conserved hypothetical protein [Mesorhizobium plurifarium]